MFHEYMTQAVFLVEEGAEPKFVDDALYEWGMAMGPLAVGDLAGIDVGWRIRQEFKHWRFLACAIRRQGTGWRRWGVSARKRGGVGISYDVQRTPAPDPEVTAIAEAVAKEQGIARRRLAAKRCWSGVAVAGERRRADPGRRHRAAGGDIDIIYVKATVSGMAGRADEVGGVGGAGGHVRRIRKLGWEPAPLLLKLAAGSGKFDA